MPILIDVKARCDYCDKELIEEDVPLNFDRQPRWGKVTEQMSEKGWKMRVTETGKNWMIFCGKCK